ncbi:MAG: hypothetical protein Q3W83_05135 [Ruminococcus sp.]|nr:hypothetical protein [Ruminococcus sp.]MDR4077296.1 hypothetical protein [Ruminococcus sp.]
MKNSTAPNRKTGRMIAKNLIVLFTVALAGFCGIQAWFTDKSSAEADGINIECQAPDGIEIAVVKHEDPAPKDDAAYKNTIELNSKNYSFIDDIKMTEVSSDGYTFYKPPLKQENGVASPILDVADWALADSSVHFLSFDLYVRSKSKFDIYLDSKSKISPNAKNLTGENADNKSDFGESGDSKGISRDCVTGAVRFSVANYKTYETKLLWIPAPNILLNVNSDTTKYSVSTDKREGESYSHGYYEKDGSKWVKKFVSADDGSSLGQVFVANSDGFTTKGDYTYELGSKKKIMSLEKDTTQNGIYTGMVTCNMWVDGEDAEARLALVNGKFKANLVLSKGDEQ